jgi:succinate dehydrogenase/fumarate reductase flavoprotein subunit
MEKIQIENQTVTVHRCNTIIVGAGAAGVNCAVHLYEFMTDNGVTDAEKRIAVVTGGISLGTSRMSGSDKQTYYKMGTSPETADSAEEFAKSLTAAGCCHHDLALIEAIGSLREFYHLVQAGVPFPHDPAGSYIGYKTDHDPYERATSAGPKTSKFMSQCLQKQLERYGIAIHDNHEAAKLITIGDGDSKRIVGVATIDKKQIDSDNLAINLYLCQNLVLAAGGPGDLYKTTVYPKGQTGIHGLALEAGLIAENLTESQFGLASIKFRWNVSGTYMQALPRIFSTDAEGNDPREFLTPFFDSMSKMATDIFLKGYQWPFDPQRITDHQSSLIDVIVFNETQKGRRVFMDFLKDPVGNDSMKPFKIDDLEPEALDYLTATGALQSTPIQRLEHMNSPAIEIYKENGIDLYTEPLEIAVCAQHNNGGFAVDKWWRSNIKNTFVIGEMAGTHGVKRPGGSALNAGQTGGLRAAEYIANACNTDTCDYDKNQSQIKSEITQLITELTNQSNAELSPQTAIELIQSCMTASAGHIRELTDAQEALHETIEFHKKLTNGALTIADSNDIITALRTRHLALTAVAFLKAVAELLAQGEGSRGSHLVLADDGIEIHPDVVNKKTGNPLRFKPENESLRNSILQVVYDENSPDLFACKNTAPRPAPTERKAFEPAWQDYRQGKIYQD